MFKEKSNKLIYEFDNERVVIQPWGEDSLRVRVTHNEKLLDHNWALLPQKESTANIEIKEKRAEIKNGKITAKINKGGILKFINHNGEVLLEEDWEKPNHDLNNRLPHGSGGGAYRDGREMKPRDGENYKATLRFKARDEEKLFGMGQYQHPYLDKKGCIFELAHRNTQASIPFVISNLGYGFLWNNPAIGKATFGKNRTEWLSRSTKQIDYWITVGYDPAEIEEKYADATGKVPMMPDYGMGFWQCKLRYKSQEEILEVARKYNELDLPLDVIVVDFFHWTEQGEWKFDPEMWPYPEDMIEELNSMGIEVMVSIWPTVDYESENFYEMLEKGYLVRTERGARVTTQFMGQEVFMDPTNPGTREFVWQKAKENYWDKGVRIFWLDEAEPEYTIYDYDNYRYYLGSNLEIGNIYPVMYAKTFFDGMQEEGKENPLNMVRCAWAGSQRYGTLLWSGDVDSTFEALQNQIRIGMSVGLAGMPWFTTDIGGFHGGDIRDEDFKELLIRWFQFGCFSPVFRLHGNREPSSGLEGNTKTKSEEFGTGAENEVWSYGEKYFEIMKEYLLLRERLRPYIKEQMKAAHQKGTPVMRPLFYDFPEDEVAWEIDDQYMFGPEILVAPVIEADKFTREVYLPQETDWVNAWTGAKYDGGQTVKVESDLETIPFFLKEKADLKESIF